jgi:hypothetical protein
MKGKFAKFAAVGAATLIAGQFLAADVSAAIPAGGVRAVHIVRPATRPAKCTGVPVAGQPGTFRFVCSTLRP